MKNRKKTLIIIYLIIVSILFIICSIFWYNATKESYEYNNFKETLVEEVRENPDLFKKEFNIDNEEQLTPEVINDIYTKSTSKRYELIASISLPISIIGGLILISPILIIISTIKKYRKYRLSIDNFKQNTGYYRDLLKNYNPLELSYNNDYNLDDNALIAMILYLEKKKILTLKNENFIINEENINNLNELEKSFIDQIKNSKKVTFEISRSAITNLTDVSCKKKKLLIMDNIPKKKIIIDLIKAFIFYIILFIVWINLNKIFDMLPPTNGMFIVFTELGVFIALLLFILFYPFVRSEEHTSELQSRE